MTTIDTYNDALASLAGCHDLTAWRWSIMYRVDGLRHTDRGNVPVAIVGRLERGSGSALVKIRPALGPLGAGLWVTGSPGLDLGCGECCEVAKEAIRRVAVRLPHRLNAARVALEAAQDEYDRLALDASLVSA